jgi:hypothetical protein
LAGTCPTGVPFPKEFVEAVEQTVKRLYCDFGAGRLSAYAGATKRPWSWRDVLPTGALWTLRGVSATKDGLVVEAEGAASARCPSCGQR